MVYLYIAVLGLCLGSLVNAVVWRLHEQVNSKSKSKKEKDKLSILKGRSMCIECCHELSAMDLIPVISWVSLNGKCRYCQKKISWQYPLVEIVTSILFVFSYIFWSFNEDFSGLINFLIYSVFLFAITLGMILAVYDFKWKILPNKLVLYLGLSAVIFAVLSLFQIDELSRVMINIIASLAVSGGIFGILFQISNGKWIGGGDVKLGFALGFFVLSPQLAFMMLFLASILGSLYSLILVLIGKYKKHMHIPFGPFLLLATYFVVIYGQKIIEIYKDYIYV